MRGNKPRHSPLAQVDMEADLSTFRPIKLMHTTHSAGAGSVISFTDDIVLPNTGVCTMVYER